MNDGRKVFFDPRGRRARVTNMCLALMTTLLAVTCCVVVWGLLVPPEFPRLAQPRQGAPASADDRPAILAGRADRPPGMNAKRFFSPDAARARRYAFLTEDASAIASLRENGQELDGLIVDWLTLAALEGSTGLQPNEHARRAIASVLTIHSHLRIYPELTSRLPPSQTVAALLLPETRSRLVAALAQYLADHQFHGIAVNFSELPRSAHAVLALFLGDLGAALRPAGGEVILILAPHVVAAPVHELVANADFVLVATHDEIVAKSTGGPGPAASQAWFDAEVTRAASRIPPQKLILSVGSYAYDWDARGVRRRISVQQAWDYVRDTPTDIQLDSRALNPRFATRDQNGLRREVWMLDGVTAFNQVKTALAVQPAGIAVCCLGFEDPGVWASAGRARVPDTRALETLRRPRPGYGSFSRADGVLLSAGPGSDGARSLTYAEGWGLIVASVMTATPVEAVITTWKAVDSKAVILTFDDGPDPGVTPKLLDLLAEKSVKATFYITGAAALRAPHLLRRMYEEGHEIGHHSFSHADLAEAGPERIRVELNAVQRLLEAEVGVRSVLFRPPYAYSSYRFLDAGPHIAVTASQLGYVIAGIEVDGQDWFAPTPAIVRNVVSAVAEGRGQVVLLHDAGGNRGPTLEALPAIIDELRSKGYRFVTTHEALGRTRDDVMPRPRAEEAAAELEANLRVFVLDPFRHGIALIPAVALVVTALGVVRLIFLVWGARVQARRRRQRAESAWLPTRVTVLVPAFNEERVICKTVSTLLASTIVDRLDILVIDDGSTDRTSQIVRETFSTAPNVRVLRKENGGKPSALNYGIAQSTSDIIVAIDGDTVVLPDAVERLVRHFEDPRVGAVAGKIVVGNPVNLMTRFQSLEYITSQNLDRNAFELFNAIGVVPGALGAWRRDAVIEAGGYRDETLAEDADLTIAIALRGWRILAEPGAQALTEAPETLKAFIKQRFRWMYGTLQVAYKHCGCMQRPSGIALLTIPNVFLFQFGFTLMAPVMDVMLVWTLVTDSALAATSLILVQYWLLFQLLDALAAAAGLAFEDDRRGWRLLWLIVVQRFCYRQLLYWVAIRALLTALRGQLVGWSKLIRTGRVAMPSAGRNGVG